MIFNSVTYVLFLAGTVLTYWSLPLRGRQWLVLATSILFYGFWRFDFACLMLFSAAVDYTASLRIAASQDAARRRAWLAVSLILNLGLLFYFKYLSFAADNLAWLGQLLGMDFHPSLSIVLPLGISFYTFQTISYTVDVYRGRTEPLRDFVVYGCFVTFFPQLVAGPILRASEVVSQLSQERRFRLEDLVVGVRRILFGLLLKVGFADNIADQVDAGFNEDPNLLSALDVWTLAFLFGFQIYFDFAGYSHIALGSGRLMGVVFPENFNFPYLARSPREFWRRWHISLSSWIRDYLYLPLAGRVSGGTSRGGLDTEVGDRRGRDRALFIAWALMGLWHGAAWTFLLWGVYHSLIVYGHRVLSARVPLGDGPLGRFFAWGLTLSLMMLGWIPFRASSMAQTATMVTKVLDPRSYLSITLRENTYLVTALLLMLVTGAGLCWPYLTRSRLAARPALSFPLQTLAYAGLVAIVLIFLRPIQQFIYFQF